MRCGRSGRSCGRRWRRSRRRTCSRRCAARAAARLRCEPSCCPVRSPPFPPPCCASALLCTPLLGRTDAPVICLPPFTYPSSPFALLTASSLLRADSPPGDDEEQLPTSPTAALAPEVALVAASKRIEGLEKEVASLRQRLAQSKAKGSRRAKDEDTTGKIRDFGYILSRFDVHFAVVVTPNSCDQKCAR